MLLVWIVYLAVFCISGAFVILYKDLLALLLFCSIATVPVILLICHIIARALTRVTVSTDKNLLTRNSAALIKVGVKNRSPFPLTCIKLRLLCRNETLDTEYNCEFTVSAKAFSRVEYEFELNSQNVGNLNIRIKRALLYDLFRLFVFPVRLRFDTTVPVIPQIDEVQTALRPNNLSVGESDVFSKVKPGDDPSEVFNIRDYAGGDKLNRIHWKLTVKQDKYMVKDYSLPINESAMLYLDFTCENTDEQSLLRFDTAVEALISVSHNFCERGVMHRICWYDVNDGQFYSEQIKDDSDIYMCLGRVFCGKIGKVLPNVIDSQLFSRVYLSHLIWFTGADAARAVESIECSGVHRFLSTVVSTVISPDSAAAGSETVQVVPAVYGKVTDSLMNILL